MTLSLKANVHRLAQSDKCGNGQMVQMNQHHQHSESVALVHNRIGYSMVWRLGRKVLGRTLNACLPSAHINLYIDIYGKIVYSKLLGVITKITSKLRALRIIGT